MLWIYKITKERGTDTLHAVISSFKLFKMMVLCCPSKCHCNVSLVNDAHLSPTNLQVEQPYIKFILESSYLWELG
jgi:hypothetical protein